MDALIDEANKECNKYSEDIKHWAEFQTGVRQFGPLMKSNEARKEQGMSLIDIGKPSKYK